MATVRIFRRSVAALGIAALASGLMATSASADPRNGFVLPLECDVLGSVDVVVFSNGPASPGLDESSNRVLIPYRLEATGTFTPVGGGETETFVEQLEKRAPNNGRLDHCSFETAGSDETGTFTFSGHVWVSYTPN